HFRDETKKRHHDNVDHARSDTWPEADAFNYPRRAGVPSQGKVGRIRFRWQLRCEIGQGCEPPRAIAYYETSRGKPAGRTKSEFNVRYSEKSTKTPLRALLCFPWNPP